MTSQVSQSLATQGYVADTGGDVRTGPAQQAVSQKASSNGESVSQFNSGGSSIPNRASLKAGAPSQQLGVDVVKVHLDNEDKNYPVVVYRFVNNTSGDLIVQVPNQHDINQVRAVAAEFRARASKQPAPINVISAGSLYA